MNVLHVSNRSKVSATATDPQDTQALAYARQQRAGGVAALYLAAAYLVAMPYFIIVVDFQSLVGSTDCLWDRVGQHERGVKVRRFVAPPAVPRVVAPRPGSSETG